MLVFEIKLQDNTVIGDNATGPLLVGLARTYPEYGYTVDNCKVISIQSAASPEFPLRTRIVIERDEVQTPFYYNRFDISELITNPLWTDAELVAIKALPNSQELVTAIANKTGYNFGINGFWTSNNSIDYSGGEVTPNWYMKAVYNSTYWCGNTTIWLHQ